MVLTKLADVMKEKKVNKLALALKSGLSVETIENARKGRSVSNTTWTLIASAMKMHKEDLGPVEPVKQEEP